MNQSSNVPKPKIFISGSSWARGEWQGPRVTHSGVSQYFQDRGYTVVDATQARSYHSRVAESLGTKLSESYSDGDLVFWIQADPLLDLIIPELQTYKYKPHSNSTSLPEFSYIVQQTGGLTNLVKKELNTTYAELDQIAQRNRAKIHCIGGTFNLDLDIIKRYRNLDPAVISWMYLLLGHLSEYNQIGQSGLGVVYVWNVDYIDMTCYTKELVDRVKQEYQELIRYKEMLKEEIFHPDGYHPNRQGHWQLFEHLIKQFNL